MTKRYAKALFELAGDEGLRSAVENDLQSIEQTVAASDDFRILLDSPVIHESEKRKFFKALFQDKLQPITFHFLMLLLEKNRENLLPDIIVHYRQLLDEANGIVRGSLITAHSFSAEQLDELKKRLDKITGKKVVLTEQKDASLIGGFVIRLDNTVIDTSIKNQLARMREQMVAGE